MSSPTTPVATPLPLRKRKKHRRMATLSIALLLAGAVSTGTVYEVEQQIAAVPQQNLGILLQTQTLSGVYDRFGHLLFAIPPTGRLDVPLTLVPRNVERALIATEDAGFYKQDGFSLKAYARAAWHDLLHRDSAQGGSTLTQQLAKFVYLSDAKTLQRKWDQLVISMQIAKRFSHNQILDFYLNRVYFGAGATGIAQAAYTYFGVHPSSLHTLTLEQCALLAGLPQAPSLYDPLVNPALARTRRNEVLRRMEEQKYITYAEMRKAQATGLELHPGQGNAYPVPAVYESYRDVVLEELGHLHLLGQLAKGGLHIKTDLDPRLQRAAFAAVNNWRYYPKPLSTAHEEVQGSAVFIDPHTGGILALIGGKANTYSYEGFDYATQTQRSPGSAMKPIVAYGPAIATGRFTAGSALEDGYNNQLSFHGYTVSDWEPHSTDHGMVSLRWALSESWNAPAVWLLDKIGIDRSIAFADRAGINLNSPADHNLTIALGNVIPGISPLTLADAYASFDNRGVRLPAHAILSVTGPHNIVYYQAHVQPVRVMSPSTARQMVGLLENNVTNGIVAGAAAPGHEVAGKTGSVAYTNWSHTDSDLWVAAFTPNVVGAIWEGYPHTTLDNSLPQWSSRFPPMMFSAIIRAGWRVHHGRFDVPPATGPEYPTNFPMRPLSVSDHSSTVGYHPAMRTIVIPVTPPRHSHGHGPGSQPGQHPGGHPPTPPGPPGPPAQPGH